jgi:hypothetical protein
MRNSIKAKALEVMAAISPLVLAGVILQFAVIRMPTHLFLQFLIGAAIVIGGMILFLLGVEIGILPMGKALSAELPRRKSLFLVIGIAFLIAFAAPTATGMLPASRYSSTRRALTLVISAGAFPATVVMPRTRTSGDCRARIKARASSTPGSISQTTFCIEFQKIHYHEPQKWRIPQQGYL